MRLNRFRLPSYARRVISQLLITSFVMVLFVPFNGHATSPERASSRKRVPPIGPLAGLIEVNTTGDGDNLSPNGGCDVDTTTPGEQCTLRAAIQKANTTAGDDTIRFNIPLGQPNCSPSGHCAIFLTKELPDLTTNVRIEGPSPNLLTIRRLSGVDFRLFRVTFATEVTFSGLRLENGRAAGVNSGGAIEGQGPATVNIVDCVMNENVGGTTASSGGALANNNAGTMNVVNSVISGNRATVAGGGIVNGGTGTVNVTGSTIAQNTVTIPAINTSNGGGGGIANKSTGTVNVTNSFIVENQVLGGDPAASIRRGGGLWNASTGAMNITGCVILNNRATGEGGGVANTTGTLNVTNSTLTRNRGVGGGIFGQATVKSSAQTFRAEAKPRPSCQIVGDAGG